MIRQNELKCKCVNFRIDGRTKKEYYQDNEDMIKEKD